MGTKGQREPEVELRFTETSLKERGSPLKGGDSLKITVIDFYP